MVARDDVPCPGTPVRFDAGGNGSLSAIPWVKVGTAARAYLFFYGAELADGRVNQSPDVVIYTGGGTSAFTTKILWVTAIPGRSATISATRLDAAGGFTQRLTRSGGGSFPSQVTIPTAGCWKLTLRTGKSSGSIVVRAVDPPATSTCDATPLRRNTPDPIGAPLPWIVATPSSQGITGTVFYPLPADASGSLIYPKKQAPNNANTKILWKVPNRTAGAALVVRADRLDSPAVMAPQTFPSARDGYPGTSFPSGIDVSSTGCWLLTIRSGKAAGIAVFNSVPAA